MLARKPQGLISSDLILLVKFIMTKLDYLKCIYKEFITKLYLRGADEYECDYITLCTPDLELGCG
jgi:hypothetical protein